MTVSFPRAIPDTLLIAGLSFMPEAMVEVTPLRGGDKVSADLGPTTWRAKFESGILDRVAFGEARAWYDTLIDAQTFLGYDKIWEYPLEYPDGFGDLEISGSPWDGTGAIKSVDSTKLLTLKSVPIGFKLSKGDYLAFDYGANGHRALHRVSAGNTANGSGEMQVEVRPYVRTGAAVNDEVAFYRAAALMNIVPGSFSERQIAPDMGSISFEAVQVSP